MRHRTAYVLTKIVQQGPDVILAAHYLRSVVARIMGSFRCKPHEALRILNRPIEEWSDIAQLSRNKVLTPMVYQFYNRPAYEREKRRRRTGLFAMVNVSGSRLVYPNSIGEPQDFSGYRTGETESVNPDLDINPYLELLAKRSEYEAQPLRWTRSKKWCRNNENGPPPKPPAKILGSFHGFPNS